MAKQFSAELEEALWGDKAILKYLKICEELFKSGDRTALFGAISLCARYQAIFPDWAADAILEMESKLESGELSDFNEAFGLPASIHTSVQKTARTRRKQRKLGQHSDAVIHLLRQHRLDGGSWNADEAFQPIAEKLGISRRDVQAIYEQDKAYFEGLPRGNPQNNLHGIYNRDLPSRRRFGRKILRDNED